MSITQIFASFRSPLIVFIILLNFFILSVSYINNWDLLWMLLITLPMLIFTIYKLYRRKHSALKKFFLDQKINAIHADPEWLSHFDTSFKIDKNDLSITIDNNNCTQPYKTSIYNIRVKDSFKRRDVQKTIRELPSNDDEAVFTEGMYTYQLIGGDKILQIGPEYFGCRTEGGGFDAGKFKQNACRESVKMVELNLSSVNKQTRDIASTIGIEYPETANDGFNLSALGFTVFSNAEGMTHFLDTLHLLSGKKPIGIRICIRNKKDFYRICHAMVKTRFIPDFIVVEGADKRPGFVTNQLGMCLYDALLFVSKTLQVYGLDKNIKIIASADIISGFDLLKILALGANAVWSEMPGYKIIKYHGNNVKELLTYNTEDVADFYEGIINSTARIMEANRFRSIVDITLPKLLQRLDVFFARSQAEQYDFKRNTASANNIYESVLKVSTTTNNKKQKDIAL